jgi:hypothetical protein
MSGPTPLLRHVPSWRRRGQLYLDLENIVTTGPDEQKVHLEFQYRYTHFPKYVPGFVVAYILIDLDVPLLQLKVKESLTGPVWPRGFQEV